MRISTRKVILVLPSFDSRRQISTILPSFVVIADIIWAASYYVFIRKRKFFGALVDTRDQGQMSDVLSQYLFLMPKAGLTMSCCTYQNSLHHGQLELCM